VVLVPVGGGGLASGVATAIKALQPSVAVIGVEPELAAETQESLRAGELRHWPLEQTYRTMADGVRTSPSDLTFAHLKARLDDIVTVSEDQIAATVGLLAREANLVAEPSGALAPAAYLYRAAGLPAGRTVAIISGGNLDPALLADLIRHKPAS
jgi:threonine dehydratase